MYELLFSEVIQRQIKFIPKKDLAKIKALVLGLRDNPRPRQCKKLVGGEREYRMRYRKWRILYLVDDRKKRITVYGILSRKEAYR